MADSIPRSAGESKGIISKYIYKNVELMGWMMIPRDDDAKLKFKCNMMGGGGLAQQGTRRLQVYLQAL